MKPGKSLPIPVVTWLLLAGCATPRPPGIAPDPTLLEFLKVGSTRRPEVVNRLGAPSTVFEQDRVLTYRVAGDLKKGLWIRERVRDHYSQLNAGWIGVNYSLVPVFDKNGLLQRKSLVAVQ